MAKRGSIPADHPVPCHLVADDAPAEEISLAENTVRLQMHPADQFEAFHALHKAGTPVEDIAARFGVAESTVEKSLRLARVSTVIIEAYRDGELNLAQVQAFASTDDHAAQERVFDDINPHHTDADDIRDALTPDNEIPATDKRVKYVGLEAYEKAGGRARRDLFTEGDCGIFIIDVDLLNDLAVKKLAKSEKKILAEGWAWVEIEPSSAWDRHNQYDRIYEDLFLSPEQSARLEDLQSEQDKLRDAWIEADDESDEPERLGEIEAEIDEIESAARGYHPEQKAIAGCILTLDRNGKIEILDGYVRPEDKSKLKALRNAVADGNHESPSETATAEPGPTGMPASLIEALTSHRSKALSAALAVSHDVGLAAAVHAIADGIFYRGSRGGTCLHTHASQQHHPLAKESIAGDELDREEALWRDRIPGDVEQFWEWCLQQDRDILIALLTYCVSVSIDATQRRQDKPDCAKLRHAAKLAQALRLDMSVYFRPDAENYFGKISKDMILAGLKEATGKDVSPAMLKMKKRDLAEMAAKAVAETKWLPAILRAE
jgi:ParB family chromosome partitioning protein